jgi:hypothetical protein
MASFSGGLSSLLGDTNQAEQATDEKPKQQKKKLRLLKLVQRERNKEFRVIEKMKSLVIGIKFN